MGGMQNFERIKNFFDEKLSTIGYDGVFGVARFFNVYCELMPVQRERLEDICGQKFSIYVKNGSIICIGIAYPEYAINSIDVRLNDGRVDKDAWNVYAREYHKINKFLNNISRDVADSFGGIPIPATVEGINVKSVEEYCGMTVSHRVVAENAGLGWRGKNELIVNSRFSCALRFASIITDLPLAYGRKVKISCGPCQACLDACPFLKNKEKLKDYRESCRKYIQKLGLEAEVCGKCIKACYNNSIFKNKFKLK